MRRKTLVEDVGGEDRKVEAAAREQDNTSLKTEDDKRQKGKGGKESCLKSKGHWR